MLSPSDYKRCAELLAITENKKITLEERFDALSELSGYLMSGIEVNYKDPDYLEEIRYKNEMETPPPNDDPCFDDLEMKDWRDSFK